MTSTRATTKQIASDRSISVWCGLVMPEGRYHLLGRKEQFNPTTPQASARP